MLTAEPRVEKQLLDLVIQFFFFLLKNARIQDWATGSDVFSTLARKANSPPAERDLGCVSTMIMKTRSMENLRLFLSVPTMLRKKTKLNFSTTSKATVRNALGDLVFATMSQLWPREALRKNWFIGGRRVETYIMWSENTITASKLEEDLKTFIEGVVERSGSLTCERRFGAIW